MLACHARPRPGGRPIASVMGRVTQADVDAYHRDGYVIIRSLLSAEEAERAARLTRLEPALAEPKRNRNFVANDGAGSGAGAVETLLAKADFHPEHDVVSAWASSRRLVEPIEAIWGGAVRHYYSILMRKDPGTGGWEWHQDYGYHYEEFLRPDGYGSAMLALAPSTVENGCLRVLKRSHLLGRLEHTQCGSQLQAEPTRLAQVIASGDVEEVACELQPGDVLYYHGNTLHASAPNTSAASSRWSLILGWALETNPVVCDPDPTHAFTPLDDATVSTVIDAHEQRLLASAHSPTSKL